MEYSIEVYEKTNRDKPFDIWLERQENSLKYTIIAKVERISLGNFGSCKTLGNGIAEIKIDVGPGYRVYYSLVGSKIILLLCAGNKKTQQKDIDKANEYLKDYKTRGKSHGKK